MGRQAGGLRHRIAEVSKRSLASPLLRVLSARIVTFPITVACGLLWLRTVIGNVSTADYALVAVVVGLQFLLVFLDFGATAHILDRAGRFAADGEVLGLGAAVGQAWRTIAVGNLVVLLSAAIVAAAGLWGPVLGFPQRSSTASAAVLLTLAINLVARPMSVANALVAGLNRPTVAQWSQAVSSLLSLAGAAIVVAARLPVPWLVATPILGQLLASSICMVVSMRMAPGLLRAAVRAMARRTGPKTDMVRLAGPMLLLQIIGPLNSQLDRVILTHVSTVEAAASYSVAIQFYGSALTVVTSLFPTLWVQFAELRVTGGMHQVAERARYYLKRVGAPAILLGATLSSVIWFAGPLVSAGKIELDLALCLVLGASFPIFVARSILGLTLTDARGLSLQAGFGAVTAAVNLALTVVLAARLGALGPVLASLVAVSLDALLLAVLLRRRTRRMEPPAVS